MEFYEKFCKNDLTKPSYRVYNTIDEERKIMVNKTMFKTTGSKNKRKIINEAGGKAYSLSDTHALCQLAVTNCFNDVYYSSAQEVLNKVKDIVSKVDSETVAKIAVYSHEQAKMKDMAAYLLAVLVSREEHVLLQKIFNRIVTNSKMLCNFVQIVRSGVLGVKSFGSVTKKLINNWLTSRTPDQLFNDSIGHSNPSLKDIIRMTHPKPKDIVQSTIFAYILGKNVEDRFIYLPERVQQYEIFKRDNSTILPDVDFRLLSNCKLTESHWKILAKSMRWDMLRRNLNTLSRHNVLQDKELVQHIANVLSNKEIVKKQKVFPFELLTTYLNAKELPSKIQNALHDALEHATENISDFETDTIVCVDVSSSMKSPATGNRGSATSVTTCVQVAALFASSILRKNSGETTVVPFDTSVKCINIDGRDSVMTNTKKLSLNGGGTDCSCALRHINNLGKKANLIVYISDNQSWYQANGTMLGEWNKFKANNPEAKMVLIDIQPYCNTQCFDNKKVINIGGFSDSQFTIINNFVRNGQIDFVKTIKEIKL